MLAVDSAIAGSLPSHPDPLVDRGRRNATSIASVLSQLASWSQSDVESSSQIGVGALSNGVNAVVIEVVIRDVGDSCLHLIGQDLR